MLQLQEAYLLLVEVLIGRGKRRSQSKLVIIKARSFVSLLLFFCVCGGGGGGGRLFHILSAIFAY